METEELANRLKTHEEYVLEMLQYFHTYHSAINDTRARIDGNGNSAENRVNGQRRSNSDVYRLLYAPIGEVGPEIVIDASSEEDENDPSEKNSNKNNK
ncbi:uncharacterized protein LOC113549938 isoform X2 [Rhopalosiphum maidis]|uniref:uncharacterized protein LOC113549938 isoform X2 n=1 Tax=Rhopalosiphum maidis TaxID=43146 RepID=UPI000EFFF98A|nr:uncharacterized protein LOC113549938 isoform X2 [Rhopalosiphum maidis]